MSVTALRVLELITKPTPRGSHTLVVAAFGFGAGAGLGLALGLALGFVFAVGAGFAWGLALGWFWFRACGLAEELKKKEYFSIAHSNAFASVEGCATLVSCRHSMSILNVSIICMICSRLACSCKPLQLRVPILMVLPYARCLVSVFGFGVVVGLGWFGVLALFSSFILGVSS